MSHSTYRKKGMVARACTERKQKNKARLIIVIYEKSYHRNLHVTTTSTTTTTTTVSKIISRYHPH